MRLQGRSKVAQGLNEDDVVPDTSIPVPVEYAAMREADGDLDMALATQDVHARGSHIDAAATRELIDELKNDPEANVGTNEIATAGVAEATLSEGGSVEEDLRSTFGSPMKDNIYCSSR